MMSPEDIATRMATAGVPLAAENVAALLRIASQRKLDAGDVLLREGTASDTLFIVCGGELAVTIESGAELGRCGAGAIVGEVSLLDRGPASATLTASLPTTVLALDRATFDVLYRDEPRVATAVLQALCATLSARVRKSSDMLEALAATDTQSAAPTPSILEVLRTLLFGAKGAA